MNIKRGILVLLFLIYFCDLASATLGISPAIVNINYVSGEEHEIVYTIISDKPNQEITISASGELAKYATLSKKSSVGASSFTVSLKLLEGADIEPGEHFIGIIVKEVPTDDYFIGTAIEVGVNIKVFVPYPGRYINARLNIPDVNINEDIPVEVYVINRGKEEIEVDVNISFLSESGEEVGGLKFNSAILGPAKEKYFRRFYNTSGLKPGRYNAIANIFYGENKRINESFRIGSLFVNITNFTRVLPKKNIQKFYLDIESKWNGNLNGVYADLTVYNETKNVSFRTPSIELGSWQSATLTGFLDTNELEGNYKLKIILNYAGEKTYDFGDILIVKAGLNFIYYAAGIIALLLIIIIIIFIIIVRKKSLFRPRLLEKTIKRRSYKKTL